MFKIPEKIKYEVDDAMMGDGFEPNDPAKRDDLSEFCEILQDLCDEKCLFVEVVEITDSWNGASHRNFPKWLAREIPWDEALERYANEHEHDLKMRVIERLGEAWKNGNTLDLKKARAWIEERLKELDEKDEKETKVPNLGTICLPRNQPDFHMKVKGGLVLLTVKGSYKISIQMEKDLWERIRGSWRD